MGYGILTKLTSGEQSVKIKTTGGYIELEANHRLVMCNYPFFFIGNQKSIRNEKKKWKVHDDEQQEVKETNNTTNIGK